MEKALPVLPNTSVLRSAIVRRVVKFHTWNNFIAFLAMCWQHPLCCTACGNKPIPVWLSITGHCPWSLPPHLPDCHTVHNWASVLGRLGLQADRKRGSAAGRLVLLIASSCAGVVFFLGCICFLLLLSILHQERT